MLDDYLQFACRLPTIELFISKYPVTLSTIEPFLVEYQPIHCRLTHYSLRLSIFIPCGRLPAFRKPLTDSFRYDIVENLLSFVDYMAHTCRLSCTRLSTTWHIHVDFLLHPYPKQKTALVRTVLLSILPTSR